jgi:alpha-ribazole phosphatase
VKLYLIRHPEPLIEAGICYGVSDMPAKTEALQVCLLALKPALHALNGITIYTSPLQRCAALATSLHELLPASKKVLSPELLELNFGHWEGQSWDAIYATDSEGLDAWATQPVNFAPGGGESLAQLHTRITQWLKTVLASGEQQAIVVTHGGPLRVLLSMNKISDQNSPIEAALNLQAPAWGSLNTLEITL